MTGVWPALLMVAFVVFAGVVLAFCLRGGPPRDPVERMLHNTPRFSIAQLPEDAPGRAVGIARPLGQPLFAPLSGRPCVCYVVTVQAQTRKGHWYQELREARGVPFVLDDGSGYAIVDPEGAELALDIDASGYSGMFDEAGPVELAFLARHGRSSRGSLRYYEAVIAIGERAAVMGCAVREPDPGAPPAEGYREGPAMRVRLAGSARFPLRISDAETTTT